jgi:hypothetical protein
MAAARAVLTSDRLLRLAAAVGLCLIVSACGSTSANVAHIGMTSTTTSSSSGPRAFSACMRSHGLANFPDPGSDGRFHAAGIDTRSRAYQAAYQACRPLDPGGPAGSHIVGQQTREQLEQQLPRLLAFAACMRAHGVPKFADPEISPSGHSIAYPVVDTHSPAFAPAAAACRSKLTRDESTELFGLLGGGKQSAPHGGK